MVSCSYVVLPYGMKCVRLRRSSSITKWAARISREWFDLESPNFAKASAPAYSVATLDKTWQTISGRELSQKILSKILPLTASSRILVAWRFAYPTNWWASCYFQHSISATRVGTTKRSVTWEESLMSGTHDLGCKNNQLLTYFLCV